MTLPPALPACLQKLLPSGTGNYEFTFEVSSKNMDGQVTAHWNADFHSELLLSAVHVSVFSVTTVDVVHLTFPLLVPGPHSGLYRGKTVIRDRRGEKCTSALYSIDI